MSNILKDSTEIRIMTSYNSKVKVSLEASQYIREDIAYVLNGEDLTRVLTPDQKDEEIKRLEECIENKDKFYSDLIKEVKTAAKNYDLHSIFLLLKIEDEDSE